MLDYLNYLDILPIHPKPYEGESFTSYLNRLVIENRFQYRSSFTYLVYKDKRIIPSALFTDRGPPLVDGVPDFGDLPRIIKCSVDELLNLTFAGIIIRAGYETGYICRHLMGVNWNPKKSTWFCPLCYLESGYYKLIWQFPTISICDMHKVYLVEACHKSVLINGEYRNPVGCKKCHPEKAKIEPVLDEETFVNQIQEYSIANLALYCKEDANLTEKSLELFKLKMDRLKPHEYDPGPRCTLPWEDESGYDVVAEFGDSIVDIRSRVIEIFLENYWIDLYNY